MKRLLRTIPIFILFISSAMIVTAQTGDLFQLPSPTLEFKFDPEVCAGQGLSGNYSAECLFTMETFPSPDYQRVNKDGFTLNYYNYWQIGPEATPLFDTPGGNVVGDIPAGYNFVNAVNIADNWLQIEGGQWVPQNEALYTQASEFTGILVDDDLAHPFAWILDTFGIYPSLVPGGPQVPETERFLKRYDQVYIFDEVVDDEGWTWYLIGPDQWIRQTFVGISQRVERPEGVSGRWVAVDLFEQTLVAYEDDTPVFTTLISSGVDAFGTNEGVFTVWARLDRDGMSGATGAPDAYALQSVPWTMYFDGGISLHGTFWHDLFGYRHSHGCVNMSISDARFVFDWTAGDIPNENGDIDTFVYVYSSGEYRT